MLPYYNIVTVYKFYIEGEECINHQNTSGNNVVHSTPVGIYMMHNQLHGCSRITNFDIYKAFDFAIYSQISSSLEIVNVKIADSHAGILAHIEGPPSAEHIRKDLYVKIFRSTFVGQSGIFDCTTDVIDETTNNMKYSSQARSHGSRKSNKNFNVAIYAGTFSQNNLAPKFGFDSVMANPCISGETRIEGMLMYKGAYINNQHTLINRTLPETSDSIMFIPQIMFISIMEMMRDV